MRLSPALPLVLALCACKPAAEEPDPAPPPVAPAAAVPAAPSIFQGDLNALGTEPFWALEIRATTLKFTRPDAPDLVAPNPGPKLEPSKAVWPAQGLVVTLTEGQCSDGMSDRTYPFFAEVTVGIDMFKGCATQASALQPAT